MDSATVLPDSDVPVGQLHEFLERMRTGVPQTHPPDETWPDMVVRINRPGLYEILPEHFDGWLEQPPAFENSEFCPFAYFGHTTVHGTFLLFLREDDGRFLVRHMTPADTDAFRDLRRLPSRW